MMAMAVRLAEQHADGAATSQQPVGLQEMCNSVQEMVQRLD